MNIQTIFSQDLSEFLSQADSVEIYDLENVPLGEACSSMRTPGARGEWRLLREGAQQSWGVSK